MNKAKAPLDDLENLSASAFQVEEIAAEVAEGLAQAQAQAQEGAAQAEAQQEGAAQEE